MLTMAPLGATSTYVAAQAVVAALERDDWAAALEAMGAFTGPQLIEVRNKAVALGADPVAIDSIMPGSGEIIEVHGEAPVVAPATSSKIPWSWVLLGLAAIGGGYWFYRRQNGGG
jgi:hypothetical protein